MSKEQRKIRHWLDSEFSIMHIYILVVIWLLTDGWLPHVFVGVLIGINTAYALRKALWLASVDKDYLKTPRINILDSLTPSTPKEDKEKSYERRN